MGDVVCSATIPPLATSRAVGHGDILAGVLGAPAIAISLRVVLADVSDVRPFLLQGECKRLSIYSVTAGTRRPTISAPDCTKYLRHEFEPQELFPGADRPAAPPASAPAA
jgi:hypothetical protein